MQPVPEYSETDLSRVVARDFEARRAAEVLRALEDYGAEAWHTEVLRVRMACLKLADGDVIRLRAALIAACEDFRDVLACAEYPRYLRAHDAASKREAVAQDWEELQAWLHRS